MVVCTRSVCTGTARPRFRWVLRRGRLVISRAGFGSREGAISGVSAPTIRIAEHRQPRIDALNKSIPRIEKQLGVVIEVVEYPAPEKDYLSKLLTELGARRAGDMLMHDAGSGTLPEEVAAQWAVPWVEQNLAHSSETA